jgi:hypothetical protein
VGDPSGMVAEIRFACGSIRITLLDIASCAQTEPIPKASLVGPQRTSGSPSGIDATTTIVTGSIPVTVLGFMFATHTAPAPIASPPTAGAGIDATTFPAEGRFANFPARQRNQYERY